MTPTWTPDNMPDLKGKVVVAFSHWIADTHLPNSKGLGIHTVKHLAKHGAKVYCGARSKERFDKAQQQLLEEDTKFPQDRLIFLKLDLGNIEGVLEAVKEVKAKESSIHILINGAGMATSQSSKKSEWDEVMTVTCAEKTSDVRVVSIASNTPGIFLPKNYEFGLTTPACFHKVVPYYPWRWQYLLSQFFGMDMVHYSIAKVATMLFVEGLQQRVDERNLPILCLSLNPGGVATDGAEDILKPLFRPLLRVGRLTPNQGSYHSLWAATAKEPRQGFGKFKGNYLEPVGVVTTQHPVMDDEKQHQGLWDATTAEVNRYLDSRGLGSLLEWK
ncbi:unnamed protein product [Clonostachys rosea f. rosea IK726]|uniref:Ketoreductase (KR) domain-containing protein n=2 Tax=Bionectria ochroleuca TaxID=29856 RepID=A0A0B7JNB3_BIOOC|nr:unnamed protein product [Clonostachys rosea f. rosea IK726]